MKPADFGPLDDHIATVLERIEQEEERLRRERETLNERLMRLQRERIIAGAPIDDSALREFLAKPYTIRPLGDDKYELIVPRFTGFRGGWPLRTDGAFNVYLVSRFIHLINPLDEWLAKELGYQASPYHATFSSNTLVVDKGDPKAVAAKLGKGVAKVEGNRIQIKPASRFDIIRRIIREDGILPYAPAPIPRDLVRDPDQFIAHDEHGKPAFTLRDHQLRDYRRLFDLGAVALFAYGQTGKSYVPLLALAALKGRKIIFAPTRALRDQWQMRLQMLTPEAAREVSVTTYHSLAKYRDDEFTLGVFDEAHHLPADLFIEAATIKMSARIGLSATPVREDGNEELIPALCGFPLGFDWPIAETQKPRVWVWIVKDEAAKISKCAELVAKPIDGKTLVFTWRLDIGEKTRKRLGVPFVSGQTRKPLDVIGENDTVVISKVGDAGLSFPVDRIVEIDFQFGSRQEAGQRLLRAAYDTGRRAEYHVLMTRDEFERYSKRLLVYEQWGLDVQIVDPEANSTAWRMRDAREPRASRTKPRVVSAGPKPIEPSAVKEEPKDEIADALAMRPIAVKLAEAEKNIGARTAPYCKMVFRYCFKAAFSPRDISDGRGITDAATRSRIQSACKAMVKAGLLVDAGQGRYRVNQEEIERARVLSAAMR